MYRKVIPEVLRQKILKDTQWRLKSSAQLLLNDSLDGQWNATYGNSAGAELCSPETLLGLPAGSLGVSPRGARGGLGQSCQTPIRAPAWCSSLPLRHSLTLSCRGLSPRVLHKTRNHTESAGWGKCIFPGARFFMCLPVFWLCIYCSNLQLNYKNIWSPQNFDLILAGEKDNNLKYLHS